MRIPSFLSLHQLRTSHEYNLCILAMFTMSCRDVKYVNWSNLGVVNLYVLKSETRWESAVKWRFPDDIVVKDRVTFKTRMRVSLQHTVQCG